MPQCSVSMLYSIACNRKISSNNFLPWPLSNCANHTKDQNFVYYRTSVGSTHCHNNATVIYRVQWILLEEDWWLAYLCVCTCVIGFRCNINWSCAESNCPAMLWYWRLGFSQWAYCHTHKEKKSVENGEYDHSITVCVHVCSYRYVENVLWLLIDFSQDG